MQKNYNNKKLSQGPKKEKNCAIKIKIRIGSFSCERCAHYQTGNEVM